VQGGIPETSGEKLPATDLSHAADPLCAARCGMASSTGAGGSRGVSLEQMVGHVPGHPGLLPRLVPAYPAGTGPNA
jgi:hypothetical protein